MAFDRVPTPEWAGLQNAASTLRQIDNWVTSPPIVALVRAFGGDIDGARPEEISCRLQVFAATHWDFRKGRERDSAKHFDFDKDQSELIMSAATALGLADSLCPRSPRYDAVLVLGGLVRACIVRPRYAAQLIRNGLATQEVVALGAFRPLSPSEHELAGRLGLSAHDELTALTEGVEAAFGEFLVGLPDIVSQNVPEYPARSWRTITWRASIRPSDIFGQVTIVAAPTSRSGASRANTADAYSFWASRLRPPIVKSVLIVTHPIYIPYQGCTAIQILGLGHGLDVEIVGVSQDAADLSVETQMFEPAQFLQEIRSGIDAMLQLRSAIVSRSAELSYPRKYTKY